MQRQLSQNQKGEIDFRKKLYLQQVEGKPIFDDEFEAADIEKILADRMKKTQDQMTALRQRGIALSPYIEIGAERCQRSLVMENDLGANGAAIDISYDLLRSCDHYRRIFGRARSPLRICCDAYNLPFMTNSVPFVFCYETLHHFPDPRPVMEEIYRVLRPGGWFFFDEEPYKQVLHIDLYKGKKIYSRDSLNRGTLRRVVDRFFRARSCNEVDYAIIENDRISVKSWKQALSPFDKKDVELSPSSRYPVLRSKLCNPSSHIKYLAAYLLGGVVSGVAGKLADNVARHCSIYDALICPSCRERGAEVLLCQKKLELSCPECLKTYPVIDQVLFLFTYAKLAELYPEIFGSFQRERNVLS